jgi:hypothetical protein
MKDLAVVVFAMLLAGPAQAATCVDQKKASAPDGRYQDNADGTITDILHGLEWKRCSEGQNGSDCSTGTASLMNWQQALQLVESLNTSGGYAGHTDWRLPNLKELATLIENQCMQPAINETLFPEAQPFWYWTSSANLTSTSDNSTWQIDFDIGRQFSGSRNGQAHVRLVRSD